MKSISRYSLTAGWLAAVAICGSVAAADTADLDRTLAAAHRYHIGVSRAAFDTIDQWVRDTRPGDPWRRELEIGLAQLAASDADIEARRLACRTLWIVGTEASLPALLELLIREDTTGMAAYALRNHPAPEVNAALGELLDRTEGVVRLTIIDLLGSRRDPEAVTPLRAFASSSDPVEAGAALAAIGRIGTPVAARTLNEFWSASSEVSLELQQAALQCAQQLEQAGRRRPAQRLFRRLHDRGTTSRLQVAGFLGLVRLGGPDAANRAAMALDSEDRLLVATALAQVPTLEGDSVTELFVSRLDTLPTSKRAALLRVLGERGDWAALPAVTQRVSAESDEEAVAAIEAVGILGDAGSVEVLLLAANQGQAVRTAAALGALRRLAGAGVDAALLAGYPDTEPAVRAGLIGVLADRGVTAAVPQLIDSAQGPNPAVATASFAALGRLAGGDELPALSRSLARIQVPEALVAGQESLLQVARRSGTADGAAAVLLAQYAAVDRAEVREAFLQVFAGLGSDLALAGVLAALHDESGGVRESALRALAEWPSPHALPALMHLAREPGLGEAQVRQHVLALRGAIRLLGQMEPEDEVPMLDHYQEALDLCRRGEERKLALAALGQSGLPGAYALVLPFLEVDSLRAEAANAVLMLARATAAKAPSATRTALEQVVAADVPENLKAEARKLVEAGP